MNEEARLAFINSRVACALITMEGMKAENRMREVEGKSPAYIEEHFERLIDQFGIGYNDVVGYLRS